MTIYRCISADPPWKFGDKLPGKTRGAEKNYPCMTLRELKDMRSLPLFDSFAEDAFLWLWRVGAMQSEALELADAWGFNPPTSEIVWVKMTDDGSRPRIGMGRTVRNCHEVALLCKRGRPAVDSHSVPSVVFAPRGRHSAKPQAFYDAVERLCPGPRLELFARAPRPGWDVWGNEVSDGPTPTPA